MTIPDPFADWLAANNIPLDRIVMMPEISVTSGGAGGQIWIQSPYRSEDDTTGAMFLNRWPGTWMQEYPLIVEPDEDMLAAYEVARQEWLIHETVSALGRAGATVLRPVAGDSLVLFVTERITDEVMEILAGLIPAEVRFAVLDGVTAVVHASGASPSAEEKP